MKYLNKNKLLVKVNENVILLANCRNSIAKQQQNSIEE
jgi:hypothetical protein